MDLDAEESNNSPIDFYYDNDEYYNYADYGYGDDGLYQACVTQLTSGNCNTEPNQLHSLYINAGLVMACPLPKGSAEYTSK